MAVDIIEMHDITLQRGNVEILKNISLGIPAGKITLVIGLAGCGKSSLLKTIAGLLVPSAGKITIDGSDIAEFNDNQILAFRKRTGFVFQDGALWSNRTVYENIQLPLILHNPHLTKNEIDKIIQELLEKVGYSDSMQLRPAQLSAGENKQVSFARGICNDPEILFLDFPTSGIDTRNAGKIELLIKDFKLKEKTVIITTYDSRIMTMFADYLIALDQGEIVEKGPYPEILLSKNTRLKDIIKDVIEKAEEQFESNDLLDLMSTGD